MFADDPDRATSAACADEAPESRYFSAAVCDLNGVLRGKRMPSSKLAQVRKAGIRMPMSSIGVDIWGVDVAGTKLTMESGDLDGICLPTGRAPVSLGWAGCDAPLLPLMMWKEDGTPYFADARHLLSAVLARFAAKGLRPVVATELEFYLLEAEGTPAPAGFRPGTISGDFDNIYSLDELDAASAFLDDVYRTAEACGIEVEAAIAEGSPRQFEFNLLHRPDALKIADDTVFFKQIVKNIARRHGHVASFMAKPCREWAGSGMHVHFSIVDDKGANIFNDDTNRGADAMRHAVGGLLATMTEMTLAFAPHLNSYRRLCPGGLAPTTVAWGYENRTSAVRIPAGDPVARRIEHRVAGADANPYIVLAAILSAALYGIEGRIEPPEPLRNNSHDADCESLARDWRQALGCFSASERVQALLHPEFVNAFAACKRQEQDEFGARISEFELATYRLSV
ncbi:glutamine synthetase family protein [Mesorhizobium sp. KR1-2]|uniref:glutamine synthetase family protein n=1 Tax=Mesorhizobium sp. KR1-2 TaxID=3156609 RepID=UPI0032B31765